MKRLAVLSALAVIACVGFAADTEKQAEKKPKVMTRYALIRVVAATESGLANEDLIRSLLTSDELVRGAIASVLRLRPEDTVVEQLKEKISFFEEKRKNPAPLPPGIAMLRIVCESVDERVQPEKFLNAISDALQKMLNTLDPLQQRRDVGRERQARYIAELPKELTQAQNTLWNLANLHKTSFDPKQVAEDLARLEAQKQTLELSLKGAEARRAGLKDLIEELEEKVAKATDDSIVKELEKAVLARTQILELMKDRQSAETLAAEDELARARADLARSKQQLAADAGGDRIAELQRQVQDSEIEQAELKAKLEAIHGLMTPPSSAVMMMRQRVEALEETYRKAIQDDLRHREQDRLYIYPRVTVISAGAPLGLDTI
ncbi:MAG TPA: hypothetical protein VL175_18665 [Pirellulales bacterium]|jgi:DNA repair exonuclease SbcCD ATPase subunit|nr:hypothetical protein [Pirellulales bacterium]